MWRVYFGPAPTHPELDKLLESARQNPATDEQLQEQRISFAYGNAPADSGITKDSVRAAARRIRLGGVRA